MGNCMPDRIPTATGSKFEKLDSRITENQSPKKTYQIINAEPQRKLLFRNAPLRNCEFLYNKFHHDNARPDQINMEWQIDSVDYHAEVLRFWVINRVPVKIWVVIDGVEKKTVTGLYLEIRNYTFVKQFDIKSQVPGSPPQLQEVAIPNLGYQNKLKIILQSVSDPRQSLCLINSYKLNEGRFRIERQELIWNSLAFELENIYNQNEQAHKQTNLDKDTFSQCVICNGQPAACILLPCRHMCIGKNCLIQFKRHYKACPLCKKAVQQTIIYRQITR